MAKARALSGVFAICWALVELYEATFAPAYLREAANLADQMKGRFWDGDSGGFYQTAEGVFLSQDQLPPGGKQAAQSVQRVHRRRAGSFPENSVENVYNFSYLELWENLCKHT